MAWRVDFAALGKFQGSLSAAVHILRWILMPFPLGQVSQHESQPHNHQHQCQSACEAVCMVKMQILYVPNLKWHLIKSSAGSFGAQTWVKRGNSHGKLSLQKNRSQIFFFSSQKNYPGDVKKRKMAPAIRFPFYGCATYLIGL